MRARRRQWGVEVQDQSAGSQPGSIEPGPNPSQRWRLSAFLRVASIGFIVAFGAFSVAIIVTGSGTGFGGALVADAVMALLAWRWILVPYLEIDSDGVTVQNAFRRHRFPWNQVKRTWSGNYGIWFDLEGERTICASAIQKSPAALLFGWKTRSDRVADIIRAYAERAGVEVQTR